MSLISSDLQNHGSKSVANLEIFGRNILLTLIAFFMAYALAEASAKDAASLAARIVMKFPD
jgi:hypothetical protein